MKLTRRSRFCTVLLALASMLFMQLAVAAYACPGLQTSFVDLSSAAMPADCNQVFAHGDNMDPAQPKLCDAHCNAADQTIDHAQPGHLPTLLTTGFLLVALDLRSTNSARATPASSPVLTRALGPPLSIRNCCFRI